MSAFLCSKIAPSTAKAPGRMPSCHETISDNGCEARFGMAGIGSGAVAQIERPKRRRKP